MKSYFEWGRKKEFYHEVEIQSHLPLRTFVLTLVSFVVKEEFHHKGDKGFTKDTKGKTKEFRNSEIGFRIY